MNTTTDRTLPAWAYLLLIAVTVPGMTWLLKSAGVTHIAIRIPLSFFLSLFVLAGAQRAFGRPVDRHDGGRVDTDGHVGEKHR